MGSPGVWNFKANSLPHSAADLASVPSLLVFTSALELAMVPWIPTPCLALWHQSTLISTQPHAHSFPTSSLWMRVDAQSVCELTHWGLPGSAAHWSQTMALWSQWKSYSVDFLWTQTPVSSELPTFSCLNLFPHTFLSPWLGPERKILPHQ